MFALVDCNNFFVSCERAFNPKLANKPVVVLSNNDGCVISRSEEAKAIGIPMAAPLFKIDETIRRFNVYVLSANFSLYGDMSQRVMTSLQHFCPEIEIYSIDEAFLSLNHFNYYDLEQYAIHIRAKILKWTGIPTCIGIARSKTLAKIANTIAKKQANTGIHFFTDTKTTEAALKNFAAADIWGIGRKLAPKLTKLGINSAYDLMHYPPKLLRKHFNVVLERMAYELQGVSCLPLEDISSRKHIQSSRSFGRPVIDVQELKEAISHYAANACEKLRSQQSTTQAVCVYLRTSRYKENDDYFSDSATVPLPQATNDTRIITNYATQLIEELFFAGFRYHKCGIILYDLAPEKRQQKDLIMMDNSNAKPELMQVLDQVNQKYGKSTLMLAAEGIEKKWRMRAAKRSPRYTTHWQEIVCAIA